MKFGLQIVNFLKNHSHKITGINVNAHPTDGFLKITLENGEEKMFDHWDEEDQGLFACTFNNEPWDSSKRGIPATLVVNANAEKLTIRTDKPLAYTVNDKPLDVWGEKTNPTMWEKRVANSTENKSSSQPNNTGTGFGGMKKGFLNQ